MNDTATITLPGQHGPIILKLLTSRLFSVEDEAQSLLFTIQENPLVTLSAATPSDLPSPLNPALAAAAMEYLFARNPLLESIGVAAELLPHLAHCGFDITLPSTDPTHENSHIVSRPAFFQSRFLWHKQGHQATWYESWTTDNTNVDHPVRAPQPSGVLYERYDYQSDTQISFRTIDPDTDLEQFHDWMNQPRVAEFWEMAQSADELRDYLETGLTDSRTWPVIGSFNGEAFGYFEIYWAMEDRIAPYYDCSPWDRGFHLLVGDPRFLGERYSGCWSRSITHFLFLDDPRTRRLVGEPRHDNRRLLKLLEPGGWQFVKTFDFPHKRSALVDCDRARYFQEVAL